MKTCCFVLFISFAVNALAAKPNVIIILADDQGYGDLSCHENPVVQTPNLDRLAGESVCFTNFHVAPMCTPTRGQLMTGCDAVRNGAVNVSSGRTLLRREFETMPEVLGKHGYSTGLFGKWHLGDNYPYRPEDRGFDETLSFPSSHIGSVPDQWLNDYFDDTYLVNGQKQKFKGYTTDVFFDEAMAWMKKQQQSDKPFFVYLPTAAPHSPLYVPQKYRDAVQPRLQAALSQLPPLDTQQQANLISFLAMIENLDENIGRLETFLIEQGLREDTLLIFMADNGSTMGEIYFNAGMRGKKTTLWEGGHRVPLFMRWPAGNFDAPGERADLTQVQDILPTVLMLTDCPNQFAYKLDGESLAPLLRERAMRLDERYLFINYSRMPNERSYTTGQPSSADVDIDGAAVLHKQFRWLNNAELYDLEIDSLQQHNIAVDNPEIVADMRQHLNAWWQTVQHQANDPQRIIIGDAKEKPSRLTACEWWNVFVDQQSQVRRGERKNGYWNLDVAKPGEYVFELRRWPEEAGRLLRDNVAEAQLTDGQLPAGRSLAIARAKIKVGDEEKEVQLASDARSARFGIQLQAGPTQLQTWFIDSAGNELCGAYYVNVQRLD